DTSQDAFTLFSPLFATLIRWLGLIRASVDLFALCTVVHLAAVWFVVRRLFDARCAYFAVILMTCATLTYGAYRIFQSSEDYLTARSVAEAMVIVALALWLWERRTLAATTLFAALLMHPIMALPGLLLLICLSVAPRISVLCAALGLSGVVLLA